MKRLPAFAAVIALLGLAGGAGGATPAPNELVFASTRAPDFNDEVFVLDTRTGSRRNVSRSPGSDRQPVLSPDGRTIAFISDRGGLGEAVWVTPASGGPARRLGAPLGGRIDDAAWSPDGRRLMFHHLGSVYVVRLAGGEPRRISRGLFASTWLTSGAIAASESNDVVVRNLEGRVLWRRPGNIGGASARGDLALLADGRIEILSPTGRLRASFRGSVPIAWSRDGARLAYALTNDAGIGVVERTGARHVLGRDYVYVQGWSADGRSVLVFRKQPLRLVQVSLTGRVTPVPLEGGVWSPNGKALLGPDTAGRLALWRPGSRPRPLQPPPVRESCPSRTGSVAWLDDRRAVIQQGRGGKHDADLWTTNRGGTRLGRVLRSTDWAAAPEWSPDGRSFVYKSGGVHTHADGCDGPMTPHLRTAAADGSGDRALTPKDDGHFQQAPRWSPDGTRVAFHRTDLSDLSQFGVFVVDVATKAIRRLTTGYGQDVSWSPDGTRLAFSGRGVSVADIDTGGVTQIGPGLQAEWSPDGSVIAHVRNGDVWVVRPDGTDARRLADATVVGDLRWSRDGSLLAFGARDGIHIVRRDGRVVRTIPQNGARSPRFSRDDRLVAFVAPAGSARSSFSFRTELYVADVAGGPARRITRDYANVGAPSWR